MYLPADALAGGEFPQPLLDLLTGTVVSAADRPDKECRIYKKYLLKKSLPAFQKSIPPNPSDLSTCPTS